MAVSVVDHSWGLGIKRAFPNEEQNIHKNPSDKPGRVSDGSSLKKEISLLKKTLDVLADDKGHDHIAQKIFISMHAFLDDLLVLSKQVTDLEKEKEAARKKLFLLDQEHATLLKKANSMILDVRKALKSVEGMAVGEPNRFPERCFTMTDPNTVQKAGLKSVTGVIETFNRVWVLTDADAKGVDGAVRYHLSADVGMTGSKDHNAGLVARSHTPQNMVVTGLLDPQTKTIRCVSQSRKAGPR
ncbi:MAG: hypothetical protein H2057_02300 [Alphaproteobacteria bacterium]|nr:hypothetical protein [Alphaproteobacteria bacterium]